MRIKTQTALIIVATLLIGIVIGVLASGFIIHGLPRHVAGMRHREIFVDRMIAVIEPSPEQEDEIRGVLTRHAEDFADMSDRFHDDASALLDSLRSELQPLLNEEQKARLEERHRRFSKPRREFGPPGRHKPGNRPPPPPPPDDGE